LCGLHLVDLHLRHDPNCGQCRTRRWLPIFPIETSRPS